MHLLISFFIPHRTKRGNKIAQYSLGGCTPPTAPSHKLFKPRLSSEINWNPLNSKRKASYPGEGDLWEAPSKWGDWDQASTIWFHSLKCRPSSIKRTCLTFSQVDACENDTVLVRWHNLTSRFPQHSEVCDWEASHPALWWFPSSQGRA